jgi:hypothetical protein
MVPMSYSTLFIVISEVIQHELLEHGSGSMKKYFWKGDQIGRVGMSTSLGRSVIFQQITFLHLYFYQSHTPPEKSDIPSLF